MSRGAQHEPSSEPTRRFSVNIASAGTNENSSSTGAAPTITVVPPLRIASIAVRDQRRGADRVERDIGADAGQLHRGAHDVVDTGIDHVGRAEAQRLLTS